MPMVSGSLNRGRTVKQTADLRAERRAYRTPSGTVGGGGEGEGGGPNKKPV